MSKNLTRKSLALGALVALAASVFAGAPAFAADTMNLAANYTTDKTLAAPIDKTIQLNAALGAGSTAANISQLKYKVVTDGTFVVKAVATSGNYAGVTTYSTADGNATTANMFLAAGTGTSAAKTTKYVVPASSDATRVNTLDLSVAFVPDAPSTADNGRAVASTDASRSVTVTAFLDANLNGALDTGEVSQEQVVSFVAYSKITTTTTIVAPVQGDTTGVATVKFTNVNNEVVAAANVGVYFTTGTGADLSTTATNVLLVAGSVTYSATNDGFKYTSGAFDTGLAKSSAIKVQPLLGSSAISSISTTTYVAVKVGTAQTATVATRSLGSLAGNTVKSITASATNAAASGSVAGTSVSNAVALNTEKQVYFLAKDTTTPTAKAFAAQAVAVKVTSSVALSATKTLTINGTTYTSSAALPGATGVAKLALTTGTDGKALVTYKTVGFADTNTVAFEAIAENFKVTVTGTETARTFSQYIENFDGTLTAATVDGTGVAVKVQVLDQFGGTPANGTYEIVASFTSSSQTTASTSATATHAAVVDGVSTLTITDNGTGLGANVYSIARYDVASNGVLSNAVTTNLGTFTINIVAAEDLVPGAVVVTGAGTAGSSAVTKSATTGVYTVDAGALGASNTKAALAYSTFANADLRRIAVTEPVAYASDAATAVAQITVAGTVSSAATATYGGALIPGTPVTISGTSMAFASTQDSARVYGDGSLTVVSKNDGSYAFAVYSHIAGANTITIKAGSATATLSVYFADAVVADASSVKVTVADGAAQFQAGRALDVTVAIADKFGNKITTAATPTATTAGSLKVSQTGSGYLSTSGYVQAVAGSYTTKLITNAGDLGTSTISATLQYGSAASATDDITTAVSSEFGVTDADVTVGGRAVYASVEFAKGKTVTVTVDGKRLYSKLMSTDAYTELKFTQKKAGKHTVTVRLSGGIVYSETVTTTK